MFVQDQLISLVENDQVIGNISITSNDTIVPINEPATVLFENSWATDVTTFDGGPFFRISQANDVLKFNVTFPPSTQAEKYLKISFGL